MDEPQRSVLDDEPNERIVRDSASGTIQLDAASAIYDRDGRASSVIAIGTLPDGSRCYASTDDPDALSAVESGEWVGARATVTPTDAGTNRLSI